ncbi:hypothetical protein ACN8ZM_35250 [Burkholderia aenigmatica]|uniref:hypothetical protein n=1 Tax=Burkholderia aenigmatica TaxID=2015348 RepID=UPI003B4368A8
MAPYNPPTEEKKEEPHFRPSVKNLAKKTAITGARSYPHPVRDCRYCMRADRR